MDSDRVEYPDNAGLDAVDGDGEVAGEDSLTSKQPWQMKIQEERGRRRMGRMTLPPRDRMSTLDGSNHREVVATGGAEVRWAS